MKKIKFFLLKGVKLSIIPLIIIIGIFGLFFGQKYINKKRITAVNINIESFKGRYFINKKEVRKMISMNATEPLEDKNYDEINPSQMEKLLKANPFVLNAEVSKSLNGTVDIHIEQRIPVARVFAVGYMSYYVDSGGFVMPSSLNYSAKVPVITMETDSIMKRNTIRIKNKMISKIAMIIEKDSIINSFCGSLNLGLNNEFDLYPKLGNFTIHLGDTSLALDKMERLKLFLGKSLVKQGWEKYQTLSLKYKNQIVASK